MTITVEAIYEHGVFKPKQALPLGEGAAVQLVITPTAVPDDPLAAVIGICTEGPDISLAEQHDELLYGVKKPTPEKP